MKKGSPRAYPRSQAILRRHGAQDPEQLAPAVFSDYMCARAEEDAHYDALDRKRLRKLLEAQAWGRALRSARTVARRLKVAAAIEADPNVNLSALARSLGVCRATLFHDRRALGLVQPECCPGCGRPLP